ncbi:hypothetical protein JCM8202_005252 [Rhodotorula sphaerocarpa]
MSPIKAAHTWLFETHPQAGVATIYGSLNAVGDTCAQVFFSDATYDPLRTLRFFIFGFGIAPLALLWNTYLERQYPLRPSTDADLNLPPPSSEPEYVPLESIKVDAAPAADSPKLHRRTASTVSTSHDDLGMGVAGAKTPMLNGNGSAGNVLDPGTEPAKVPPVDKIVLLRRIAADQVVMAPISFVVFLVCMGLMELRTPMAIAARIRTALIPILLTNYKVWPFVQCVMFLYVPLQYRVPLSGVVNVAWTIYLSWENARTPA